MRSAPSLVKYSSVGEEEFNFSSDIDIIGGGFRVNVVNPFNIRLHVGISFGEVKIIDFLEGSHGEGSISSPGVVIGSSLVDIGIGRSQNTSLILNIDVFHEQFVHSVKVIFSERLVISFQIETFTDIGLRS